MKNIFFAFVALVGSTAFALADVTDKDAEVEAYLAAVDIHVGVYPTDAMMASADSTDLFPLTQVQEASVMNPDGIWSAEHADAQGLRDTLNELAYHSPDVETLDGPGEAPSSSMILVAGGHLFAPTTHVSLGAAEAGFFITATNASFNGDDLDTTEAPFDGVFSYFSYFS